MVKILLAKKLLLSRETGLLAFKADTCSYRQSRTL